MTQHIKPKQCGENAWYIPNQKGFVPEIGEHYWVIDEDLKCRQLRHGGNFCDYALIDAKNCFETEQEARDAFVKPVDPTPVNWDELIEIEASGGYTYTLSHVSIFDHDAGGYVSEAGSTTEFAGYIMARGRLLFETRKYWRSEESMQAWIDKFNNGA